MNDNTTNLTPRLASSLKRRLFGAAEIKALQKIVLPLETVHFAVYGYYQGGSCLLAATDQRVLLVDKRPFFLHVDVFSLDTINNISISRQFLMVTLKLRCGPKKCVFRSFSDKNLSKMERFINSKVKNNIKNTSLYRSNSRIYNKSYLHPAWTPHNAIFVPKRKVTKYYRELPGLLDIIS